LPFVPLAAPDILLDANVSVPLIQLLVNNLTAHVAVDATVASLVHLSVGVDVGITQVKSVGRRARLVGELHYWN
jgi:hypothetical protein